MDPFRQVNAGEPLRIPAPTWNRLMEVGRHFGRHRAEVQPPPPGDDPLPPAVRVLVRNDTGGGLAERAVVTLTTPPLDPTAAPFDAQRTPLFGGIAPAAATDAVAVLEGPLADGAIGRAVVMGVAVVQLDVVDVGHTHCGPTAGVTGYLTTAATGPIRVLWKESGTGSKLGMVLMQEVGDSTLTTGNVGDSGAQDSTTTVLRFNEATGSKITKGATAGDPDVHTLLAASASQMGAVTTTTQAFAGAKTFNTSVGLADSGNGYLTMDDWGDYNGNYFVGLNCNNVSTLLFDNVTGRVMLVGIGGATKYAVMDSGFNILSGGTATTGGLTFAGGLYISGTLSVSAGDVSGLAAVATSGDYADITGGPPATTTVAASYDSGTKDLTITVNGVSTTVNLT